MDKQVILQGLPVQAMCEDCLSNRKDIAIYHVIGRFVNGQLNVFTPRAVCSFCSTETVCVLVSCSMVSVN